jgi:cation diffusion facilitator CzcD-associated flavoprotein CzcO
MPSVRSKPHVLLDFAELHSFTPGSGYLEALVAGNSVVVSQEIDHVGPEGLVTVDGQHYAVDVIICATGFDTSFKPAFPVIGRDGRNLAEYWKDQPLHYLSIAAPGFPNYFGEEKAGLPLPLH